MVGSWKLSIVYDSEGLPGFATGWGFSALLSRHGLNILFDCGWDGHILRSNLGRLGLTFSDLDYVFISHCHWDHASGLPEVLRDSILGRKLEVVIPKDSSERLRREISQRAVLREVSAPEELAPGVYTTGVLGREVKEQSLVVSDRGAALVLTGCAHPGLGAILEKASRFGTPRWLVGGLHDADVKDIPDYIEKVVACHCTSRKQELIRALGGRAEIGAAGATYESP